MAQHDEMLLEKQSQNKVLSDRLTKVLAEKKQLEKSKRLVEDHNKALSSVLSQRQLNEQQLYQYTRRLETAVREQSDFSQVQKRVNDLKQEEAKDAIVIEN